MTIMIKLQDMLFREEREKEKKKTILYHQNFYLEDTNFNCLDPPPISYSSQHPRHVDTAGIDVTAPCLFSYKTGSSSPKATPKI